MMAKASYDDLLAALFRSQYQDQIERSIHSRIRKARLPERWPWPPFPSIASPASTRA